MADNPPPKGDPLNPNAFPPAPITKPGDMQMRGRDPLMDGSGGWPIPIFLSDMTFTQMGTSGLRQFGGWVREEFLPQLVGRQAARTYREMLDNSPTIGSINFAIMQSIRQVEYRVEAASDKPQAKWAVEFVESLMDDMSHTWTDFISETLTMLGYGYAPHEIVYKRRLGKKPGNGPDGQPLPKSRFKDGLIGIRKLPIRGQDTVLKWFFDSEGAIKGMTQQPWFGGLVDIPIEKMLLFRPRAHKNNPEGYSILRTAYRPWYFSKRMEEQEGIMFERFSGFPVISVPNSLLETAQLNTPQGALAQQMLAEYKRIVTNVRIDEQMGALLPSDTYTDQDGKPTNVAMYKFELVTPNTGRTTVNANETINRYKLDMMTSVLADFLTLGHGARGTQSLAETKVDLFFQAIEGWLESNAEVLNNYLLPRLWALNGLDEDDMPHFQPDMPQRIDLDGLSNFVLRLSQSGASLFPDANVENYLRDAAGLPDLTDEQSAQIMEQADAEAQAALDAANNPPPPPGATGGQPPGAKEQLQKMLAASLARRMGIMPAPTKKKRKKKAQGFYRTNG